MNEPQNGLKYDSDKIRMDLLPFESLEEIAKVLTFGAKKYSDNSWQLVPNPIPRYSAALLRHFAKYQKGEIIDSESGLPHVDHIGTNALFLIWFELHRDDNK